MVTGAQVTGRKKALLGISTVLGIVIIYIGFISTPSGARDVRVFDPDRTAALEVDMWKAYYDKRNVALFFDLMTLNREMYRCPRATAARISFYFARAAATF